MTSAYTTAIRHEPPPPPAPTNPRPPSWWGMLFFCATEAMLFACLIASFFYLRGSVDTAGSAGGEYPPLGAPLLMTAMLLASSVAAWWAERGIRVDDVTRLTRGLALAFGLGAAFLTVQGWEYAHQQFRPQTSAYWSLFFTITAVHGSHVAVGLAMLAFVQLRARLEHFTRSRHIAVRNVTLYWHTVDAIWLVILAAVYLSPRLW